MDGRGGGRYNSTSRCDLFLFACVFNVPILCMYTFIFYTSYLYLYSLWAPARPASMAAKGNNSIYF